MEEVTSLRAKYSGDSDCDWGKMVFWVNSTYFAFLCSDSSATAPASMVVRSRWDGVKVSERVSSHTENWALYLATIGLWLHGSETHIPA